MKTEDLQKEVMMNKIIVKPLHGFTICLDWLANQVQSLIKRVLLLVKNV